MIKVSIHCERDRQTQLHELSLFGLSNPLICLGSNRSHVCLLKPSVLYIHLNHDNYTCYFTLNMDAPTSIEIMSLCEKGRVSHMQERNSL